MVSWVQTKNGSYHYTFALISLVFVCLFSSFSNVKHLIIFWSSPSTMIILLLHHLACGHPFMYSHLVQGLVPRFHQLSKTKLDLSSGSVHDMRVFNDALEKFENKFPHPPEGMHVLFNVFFVLVVVFVILLTQVLCCVGNYYLVDSG